MAANAIASGSVIVTANADGLAGGLARANKEVQQWGHSAGGNLKTTLASSMGGASGGGGLGAAIGGMLTKIPGPALVAGAALAGLGVAAHEVFGTLNDLAATNKAADVLGVSASQYAGMQKVLERVGVEGSEVTSMFAKMGKNILTSGAAADQFAAMGIDAKALAGANLADQFKMIADGFTRIPRGAAQARAALEIFGKSGAELLPILQKGKAGIDELIDGESFEILTDKQYAAAGEAVKAWKQAKKDITGAWEGLVAHAAVAFAPIIKVVSNVVTKVMSFLAPVLDWYGRAWEQEGVIIAAVFEKIGEWADDFGQFLVELGQELDIFGGEWPTIQEVIVAVFRAAGTAGAFAWDTIKSGAGAVAIVIGGVLTSFDMLVKGFKEIVNLGKDLPNSLKPEWFDKFAAGVNRFEAKVESAAKKTFAWGADAMQSWGKSAGLFNSWLDKALAPKPAKPIAAKLDEPIIAATTAFEPVKFASAIERGSKEAYSIEMRSKYGEFNKPENNVHKDNGKKIDETNRLLKEASKEQKDYFEKLLAEQDSF